MNIQVQAVIDDFELMPPQDRLALLLEYSEKLPELPARFGENPELMERVTECQSPVFIAVEGSAARVELYFSAPREAPTTRGFASVLSSALSGLPSKEIVSLSPDFVESLGLTKLVSPLRMRGMSGMLARIRRKAAELAE